MTQERSGCGLQADWRHNALHMHMHAHAGDQSYPASLGQYVKTNPPRLGTSEAVREPAFEAVQEIVVNDLKFDFVFLQVQSGVQQLQVTSCKCSPW